MEYYFDDPAKVDAFPGIVTLAVDDTWSPQRAEARGLLKAVSPEEPRHALLLAIARDIQKGLPDESLVLWKRMVLSAVVEFRRLSTEA